MAVVESRAHVTAGDGGPSAVMRVQRFDGRRRRRRRRRGSAISGNYTRGGLLCKSINGTARESY